MAFGSSLKSTFSFILLLLILPLLPTITQNIRNLYHHHIDPRDAVGVIHVKGVIYDAAPYIKQLYKHFKNNEIKAILLKIESPGSASGSAQAIYQEILTLKGLYPKPIITLVENICASGGYYIASATDHIICSGSAIVGSIGATLSWLFQLKEFIEQFKVKYIPLSAGKYKLATDPFTDMTPEMKALLQSMLDDTYDQFVHDVATQRKLSLSQSSVWADGKIFNGRQALKLGLVDQLGSLSAAVSALKERALIQGEIRWIKTPERKGLFGMLNADSEGEDDIALTRLLNRACTYLENRYGNKAL